MSERRAGSSTLKVLLRTRVLLITVAMAVVLILILTRIQHGYVMSAASPASLAEARARIVEAFASIQEADITGVDQARLSELSWKLNKALNATEDAQELEKQGRLAEASDLYQDVVAACDELTIQGHLLREDALRLAFYQRVVVFTLAPILAFVTATASYFGYRWWRRREVERIFRMEILVREERRE